MLRVTPLAVDLFCGVGGWTDGLLAEGFDVVGFDNERHEYGAHRYPAQLVVQDVRTLHGRQFRDAALIVASPPCTEYSYMGMPWGRAKQIAAALRGEGDFPDGYKGSRTIEELNGLFAECFRIQREATEAAGRSVPLVVENVKAAQPWIGRARWNFGSFYLWGDVPALMPTVRPRSAQKTQGLNFSRYRKTGETSPCFSESGIKNAGGSWFGVAHNTSIGKGQNPDGRNHDGVKQGGDWFGEPGSISMTTGSKSPKRKMASALIAKIPIDLARHIARVYYPRPKAN